MPTVLIDVISIVLALTALVIWSKAAARDPEVDFVLPIVICVTYLVAQSGWTAAYLSQNYWGAVMNNYIWFIFNTLVFVHLIKSKD
jgi:heme A synthase